MTRKRKITEEADGTPVEEPESPGIQELEGTEADGTPFVEVSETPKPGRTVVWTLEGERAGAFSEHGQHVEGEHVATEHADVLIERGHAKEVE